MLNDLYLIGYCGMLLNVAVAFVGALVTQPSSIHVLLLQTQPHANSTPANSTPCKLNPANSTRQSQPLQTRPLKTQPMQSQPPKLNPCKPNPSKVNPSKLNPAKSIPSKVNPCTPHLILQGLRRHAEHAEHGAGR